MLLSSGSVVRQVRSLSTTATTKRIAVIGGGASGIFSAVSAAEHYANSHHPKDEQLQVVVLEATSKTLTKVAISGGGRCNVLHDTSKPTNEILQGYPRGKKELTGLFSKRFTPQMAQTWFQKRGVQLKTEPDGRMFPTTDKSQTVLDALLGGAEQAGVEIRLKQKVLGIAIEEDSTFKVSTQSKDNGKTQETTQDFDAIIMATGSAPVGYQLALDVLEQAETKKDKAFVSPVPSLFTLSTKLDIQEEGGLLYGLAGVSVPNAHVTFRPEQPAKEDATTTDAPKKKKKRNKKSPAHLQQEGPLLVTHHGVSGPAALRLSAFGAREFHECRYRGTLRVHWAPSLGTVEEIADELWKMTQTNPKRNVATGCPLQVTTTMKDSSGFVEKTLAAIPKRLWASMVVNGCGLEADTTWAQVNKKAVRKLATLVADCELQVTGKGTFKEEFVTAGGVSLKELDMKTMMSKSVDGFFLCGEVINVDGVTGGFNFMNCWGTGHVAGTSAVEYVFAKDIPSIDIDSATKKTIPQ